MKNKIFSLFVVIAITIFTFIPTVSAIPATKVSTIDSEATLYVGEIFVDGVSQMKYLYSSNLSNEGEIYDDLRAVLPTGFSDLVPTTLLNHRGLAVSSSHQDDMSSDWSSASYVANQYYASVGTIGTETNINMYEKDLGFKNHVDNQSYPNIESDNRLFSLNDLITQGPIYYHYCLDATTVIYISVNVTSTHTVTFKDYDGTVLKVQNNVEHGSSAVAPSNPIRTGYTFKGWDKVFDNVTSNLEVIAQYDINKYTVTFKDYDGVVLKTQNNVEHGSSVVAPSNPIRTGYTFKGWDKTFTSITVDIEVIAQYDINKYTVTFKDYDGVVLKTQNNVEYNTSAIAPSNPIRTGYTFKGWDKAFTSITADTEVIAQYDINKYTVTFKDYDGVVLRTQNNVEYNTSAIAPSNPTRKGYTFKGWDKAFTSITADIEVIAQYDINKYTVTFKDYDGVVLKTQNNVEYNTSAIAPSNPTRKGYTFKGWDKAFTSITADIEVTAQYDINKYTVTFKDYDGTVLKTQNNVEYNTSAIAPSNPTRKGYTFKGWNKSFAKITANTVVTAQYKVLHGDIEVKKVESNYGSANANLNKQNIEELIELSSDEKNAIANGKKIYVFVEVNDISDSVSTEDKELVKIKLDDGSVVGMYLDINLFKQIEGKNKYKVEETNGKIKISFEIPESLRSSNRKFYIIRIHGTEVTKIIPTIDGNTLTFETDRFSTYALVYTDIVEETKTDVIPITSNSKTSNNTVLYISIIVLSIIGIIGIGLYIKKRKFN